MRGDSEAWGKRCSVLDAPLEPHRGALRFELLSHQARSPGGSPAAPELPCYQLHTQPLPLNHTAANALQPSEAEGKAGNLKSGRSSRCRDGRPRRGFSRRRPPAALSPPENARHSGSWEVSPPQPGDRFPDPSQVQLLDDREKVRGAARASTLAPRGAQEPTRFFCTFLVYLQLQEKPPVSLESRER